jgi:hypothetical protein
MMKYPSSCFIKLESLVGKPDEDAVCEPDMDIGTDPVHKVIDPTKLD